MPEMLNLMGRLPEPVRSQMPFLLSQPYMQLVRQGMSVHERGSGSRVLLQRWVSELPREAYLSIDESCRWVVALQGMFQAWPGEERDPWWWFSFIFYVDGRLQLDRMPRNGATVTTPGRWKDIVT